MAHHQFQQSQDELIPGLPYDLAMECLLRVPITSHPTLKLVSHQWNSTISNSSFFSLRRLTSFADHHVFFIQPQSPPHHCQDDKPTITQHFDVEETEDVKEEVVNNSNNMFYTLNVYNTKSNEWRCLSGLTIPTFSQCVVLSEIGKVVVLGGCDPTTLEPVSRVLVIDLALGVWKEGCPMTKARSFFAAVAAAPATVYVSGGHDGHKNALKSAEAYDVVADEWRELPPMVEERDECFGMMMNDGKFWVVSGYGTESQGRFRPDAEVFDPERWRWETVNGVWPHQGRAPKCTAVVTVEGKRRWWDVVEEEIREFEWVEKVWRRVDLGSGSGLNRVNGLWGPSSTVCMLDVGDGKILLMGNEENSGRKGMFILDRENEDNIKLKNDNNKKKKCGVNWKWQHVEAPSRFLGFPFSTAHILM